jgi:F-type H+-transporting ATPase subunit epsilon
VIVNEDIDGLRAEDASGSFGILSGHAPFVTALAISIVSWRKAEVEQFCALRGGVMVVGDMSDIEIATREAVTGGDLATLDSEVLGRFQSDADIERTEHAETMRLQFNAIRHMVSRLNTGANLGGFK